MASPKQELFDAVAAGRPAELTNKPISAESLRRLMLGIEGNVSLPKLTSAGILVHGAIVTERLDLDNGIGAAGAGLPPLILKDCTLQEGLSARHAHLSRLSLSGCRFGAPTDEDKDKPTLDLEGATILSDLTLDRIHAVDDDPLWISAIGTRIDGNLDLEGAQLKAPDSTSGGRPLFALRLTLADIKGDLRILHGCVAKGPVLARSVRVRGDVWMRGASIDGLGSSSIVFQAAEIGGRMVLEGWEGPCGGQPRRFQARGQIDLYQIRVGGSLTAIEADLYPTVGHKPIALCLAAAHVAALEIGDRTRSVTRVFGTIELNHLEAETKVAVENAQLGSSAAPTIEGSPMIAKEVLFRSMHPLEPSAQDAGSGATGRLLSIDLKGSRLRRLELTDSQVDGYFDACSLTCEGEAVFRAEIANRVNLSGAEIDGSLDISGLRVTGKEGSLLLRSATIGRVLRLNSGGDDACAGGTSGTPQTSFSVVHEIDLEGLKCDLLHDGHGLLWGNSSKIFMNHFIYQRTLTPRSRETPKPSHLRVRDWFLAKRADGYWPRGLWPRQPPADESFWEPWQVRRNWIYRQYLEPAELERYRKSAKSLSRHPIPEKDYHPQPFEQAIRVARSEGFEDVATQYEMLKKRIEWRYFNQDVRWPLAFAGIALASLWLWHKTAISHGRLSWGETLGIFVALAATMVLMLYATALHDFMKKVFGDGFWSRFFVYALFFLPALLLFVHPAWSTHPFPFFVAFLIFAAIRCLSLFAHAVMRFGFGYLRRPVRAIMTLIVAFLVGWWGVALANRHHMLVMATVPAANLAAPEANLSYPEGESEEGRPEPPFITGVATRAGGPGFAAEISCEPTVSEPLYALDVLIPLVDLHEESRCELRRVPRFPRADAPRPGLIKRVVLGAALCDSAHPPPLLGTLPTDMSGCDLLRAFPRLLTEDHRFWWWMKALYAIAGWFIVSLALLTFAQVNRAHGEVAEAE